jgi:hypothetical protein
MQGAFWLPRAPLRGAYGVLDRRFAGRCQGLSSTRRTSTLEASMTTHPYTTFDRFACLLAELTEEVGSVEAQHLADRIVEAESADFHWEARFAEKNLGAFESWGEEEKTLTKVAIIGCFRERYYVATCLVSSERRVHTLLRLRYCESVESAQKAFEDEG